METGSDYDGESENYDGSSIEMEEQDGRTDGI